MARVLVCTSCHKGLLALGALRVDGTREGSLMDRCEAHPTNLEVHAMLVVEASELHVQRWIASERATRASLDEGFDPKDWVVVAQLATRLLIDPGLSATETEVSQAVRLARHVIRVSKGEAFG